MSHSPLVPVAEDQACEKVGHTYSRFRELLGQDSLPLPILVLGRSPVLLQDFFMNSKRFVFTDGKLSARDKALLGLVVSATRHSEIWRSFFWERSLQLGWSDQEANDALVVASACSMYNAYFKFRDLASRDVFHVLPAGLRAHTFGGTSLEEPTVELINVVVSNLNGCAACVTGHVARVTELGLGDEAVHEAIQCAATVMGALTFTSAAGHV